MDWNGIQVFPPMTGTMTVLSCEKRDASKTQYDSDYDFMHTIWLIIDQDIS